MIEQTLIAAAESLGDELGNGYVSLKLEVTALSNDDGKRSPAKVVWTSYAHGGNHYTGETLLEAMNKTRDAMAPDRIASRLRAEAAALLARADSLNAK